MEEYIIKINKPIELSFDLFTVVVLRVISVLVIVALTKYIAIG